MASVGGDAGTDRWLCESALLCEMKEIVESQGDLQEQNNSLIAEVGALREENLHLGRRVATLERLTAELQASRGPGSDVPAACQPSAQAKQPPPSLIDFDDGVDNAAGDSALSAPMGALHAEVDRPEDKSSSPMAPMGTIFTTAQDGTIHAMTPPSSPQAALTKPASVPTAMDLDGVFDAPVSSNLQQVDASTQMNLSSGKTAASHFTDPTASEAGAHDGVGYPRQEDQAAVPTPSRAAAAKEGTGIGGSAPSAGQWSPSDELQQRLKANERGKDTFLPEGHAASPSATLTMPAFFESDSAKQDPFDQAMSVKEIKVRLKQLGADFIGLAEKCELLALLRKTEAAKAQVPASPVGMRNQAAPASFPASFVHSPHRLFPEAAAPMPSPMLATPKKPDDDPFAGLK